jgi:hypothetical protein
VLNNCCQKNKNRFAFLVGQGLLSMKTYVAIAKNPCLDCGVTLSELDYEGVIKNVQS